jgi:hypothetical protein
VLILAVLSGVAVMVYANGIVNGTNGSSAESEIMPNYNFMLNYSGCPNGGPGFGRRGFGWGGFGWGGGNITVSQAYNITVISIAKNDSDVQNLLAEGYRVTEVRPIISTIIGANGTVTMQATTAIVVLENTSTNATTSVSGRAFVTVNVQEGKVTRIEILTRTVIEP